MSVRVELRGLTVRYAASAAPVLEGVDLDVAPGTLQAVLGPNGSGKSTLMRAVLGFAPHVQGAVLLEGTPIQRWDRKALARVVAAVAQAEHVAFPLTVRELVAMGRYPHLGPLETERTEDREAVDAALDACDLAPLASRDVATLSGGEFQRARIARALAQQPHALLLDEPTASLDIRHRMSIVELLRAAADDGLTVLFITHSLDLAARYADRVLLLDRGRVAADGHPRDVVREEIVTEVYGWPVRVFDNPVTGRPSVTPLPKTPPPRAGA